MKHMELPTGAIVIHPPEPAAEPGEENVRTVILAPPPPPPAPPEPARLLPLAADVATDKRASSVDALRGLFILLMNVGFTIPMAVFPEWMYHQQNPPPFGEYIELSGLTWRDVTFASFLFTMAAAIPITMTRRLEQAATYPAIMWIAVRRAFLLFTFALIIGHSNPYWINSYNPVGYVFALVGLALCFGLFTRQNRNWNPRKFKLVRTAAWIGAAALLFVGPLAYGATFSLARRDDVLAMLAFAAVAGTSIWLLSRGNTVLRLGIMAAAAAMHLGARENGWIETFWGSSPLPWLFEGWYIDLLLVIVPGLIVGDALVRWMRIPDSSSAHEAQWPRARMWTLAAIGAVAAPIVVIGLYNRWTVATTQAIAVLGVASLLLTHRPHTASERLLRELFGWGTAWLMIGLLLEPFEGGIKKVPGTFSYFLCVTGISIYLAACFAVVLDFAKAQPRWSRVLTDVGQNPMIGYVGFQLFFVGVLGLSGLLGAFTGTWWTALLRSAVIVTLIALGVQAISRRKVYWRT